MSRRNRRNTAAPPVAPAPPPARRGPGREATVDRAAPAPWWATFSLGQAEYRDAAFASSQDRQGPRDDWGYFLSRRLRYDVFWAHYEGNIYRAIHRWAGTLKESRQLYEFTRTIFSPAYRVGEFWAGHLWGGLLDPGAGDGTARPSALPVAVPEGADPARSDALRSCVARLWADSNWQDRKDTVTRFGAVKGDVAIMVVDDPARQFVSLRPVDPRTIADLRRDGQGNVREYVIQEYRPDPLADQMGPFGRYHATYTEWARRSGGSVVYTTYRDGAPFDWRYYPEGTPEDEKVGAEWSQPYGFIPLVFIQNRDFGAGFGWSELQPDFGPMYELDDLASKLSDQIRKIVDCPLYIAGAEASDVTVSFGDDDDGSRREKTPTIYGPENTEPKFLVAPLDIAQVSAHIQSIIACLERNHPELEADNVGAAASGEARRVAREKVEAIVLQRRAPYDAALVRAHQMAISIAGARGGPDGRPAYPGYEAFDEGSYDRGDLDHAIGARPVFAVTAADRLADAMSLATALQGLKNAEIPLRSRCRLAGIPEEVIEDIVEDAAGEAEASARLDARRQAAMFAGDPSEVPGQAPEDAGGSVAGDPSDVLEEGLTARPATP